MKAEVNLADVTKLLAKLLSPHSTYSTILEFLTKQFAADRCLLVVKNRPTGELKVRAFSPTLTEKDFSTDVLTDVIRRDQPPQIYNVGSDGTFRSVLILPLRDADRRNETVAALYLDRRKEKVGPFVDSDIEEIGKTASILTAKLLQQEEEHQEIEQLRREVEKLRREVKWGLFVGHSRKMQELYELIEQYAGLSYPVYIHGESGTGKELVAKALHRLSGRKKELVSLNCAAIPKELVESKLFGHEKGSFTGATNRAIGVFEQADGGTLFLDEIGDLPLDVQPKLLRVLQEKEFERVGSTQKQRANVRLIAATHHDLEAKMKAGHFRHDLYYRMTDLKIRVPALRDRREDVIPLAYYFLEECRQECGKDVAGFAPDALAALQNNHWHPGNIRDLRSVIISAVVRQTSSGPLTVHNLFPELKISVDSARIAELTGRTLDDTLENVKRYLVEQTLSRNNGVITKTSGDLGIHRKTLHGWLRDWGIGEDTTDA